MCSKFVHSLQKKHSIGSFDLLGHTAPPQAATLLVLGPFMDYWFTHRRVDAYDYTITSFVSNLVPTTRKNGISDITIVIISKVDTK